MRRFRGGGRASSLGRLLASQHDENGAIVLAVPKVGSFSGLKCSEKPLPYFPLKLRNTRDQGEGGRTRSATTRNKQTGWAGNWNRFEGLNRGRLRANSFLGERAQSRRGVKVRDQVICSGLKETMFCHDRRKTSVVTCNLKFGAAPLEICS